jgi:hypothetical protein
VYQHSVTSRVTAFLDQERPAVDRPYQPINDTNASVISSDHFG